jgi:predicted metal-binding membrane protein
MGRASVIETTLRRDRLVVAAGLALVAISAWAWTLAGFGMPMPPGGGMAMTEAIGAAAMSPAPWSPSHAALILLMWWVMMAAMMLPSAAPLVLLATALHRRKGRAGRPDLMAALLTAGYLAVWGAFSLAAALAQWSFELAGLISPGTMTAGPAIAGVILLAAGLYQLSPLKQACLRRCRSPVAFLAAHWRPGAAGAFRLGLAHGAYCVGCCWFLMALLFVGGVMNPFWIGALALYVLAEKLAPRGHLLSRASGLLLAGAGVAMLAGTV